MKKKSSIYTIILAMVFLGAHGLASAAASSENIETFLEKINEIRSAPYAYALKLGYESEDLIEKGITPEAPKYDPYSADDALTAMAEDESRLMAGEDILATKKPVHLLTASTGGVISFFNFMPRDTAFKIVIDHLFRKELEARGTSDEFHHILSETRYSSAGIAVSPGRVGTQNAWFVAISLGSSELVSEIQLLNMINQVRAEPTRIWRYSQQLDPAEALNENPNVLYLSTNAYKPLFFDASLGAAANTHSINVLNRMSPDHLVQTQTPLERAAFHGYEGERVHESALVVPSLKEDGGVSVNTLFLSLVKNELRVWPLGSAVFLADFQDAGCDIRFQPGQMEDRFDATVVSFVVGEKKQEISQDTNDQDINDNEQISRIYAVLFSDNDGNGLYSPGEELIQQTVTVYTQDMEPVQQITDNAGHFSMTLKANRLYRFETTIEEVPFFWDVPITSDQFVQLLYPPSDVLNVP